ncbi:MAG: histidine kinase [Flavobacteriaceae bacterium]|nr:histidine kinase [Flavobacteriaceae bacterium]
MKISILNKFTIIFASFISLYSLAQTLTAKQIIDKNIQETGGLTQWKLLNTISLYGNVILGDKEKYPIKIYQSRPNLTKTIVIINKKEEVIEGFDGKKGYAMNYANNKLQEYPSYKPENFDTDFIDYEQKGFTAKLLGVDKIAEQEVFKVELTKNVNKTIYYFDKQSYLLVREERKDETIDYSDYKIVGNLLMAFRIESNSPKNDNYLIILNKIEINKAFPKNTFKFKVN